MVLNKPNRRLLQTSEVKKRKKEEEMKNASTRLVSL
uniref:Uncharacterized protein MANES_18G093400 n=1 Tax=Rhizophora mucronata TaxID=61149 RepID=A0A2P2MFB5_RHIMU